MAIFPIQPHGGVLVNRVLTGDAHAEALEKAAGLPQIVLSDLNIADLEMIANGAMSPLTGYMQRADYESVVHNMRLANGLPWTIPVTLANNMTAATLTITAGKMLTGSNSVTVLIGVFLTLTSPVTAILLMRAARQRTGGL